MCFWVLVLHFSFPRKLDREETYQTVHRLYYQVYSKLQYLLAVICKSILDVVNCIQFIPEIDDIMKHLICIFQKPEYFTTPLTLSLRHKTSIILLWVTSHDFTCQREVYAVEEL